MKIKSVICFIIAALLMISMIPAVSAVELSPRLHVSEFIYRVNGVETNVLVSGGIVSAEGMVRQLKNSSSQEFFMVLLVYQKGRLISLSYDKKTATMAESIKAHVDSKALPNDVSDIKISTVFVNNLMELKPLSPPANFGSKEVQVTSFMIGKTTLPVLEGVFEYNAIAYTLSANTPPDLLVNTTDLSVKAEIPPLAMGENQAAVRFISHDQSHEITYHLHITVLPESALKGLYLNGVFLEGFNPTTTDYIVNMPLGATEVPQVTYETEKDSTMVVQTDASGIPGTCILEATGEDGSTMRYQITFAKTIAIKASHAGLKQYFATSFAYRFAIGTPGIDLASFRLNIDTLAPYWRWNARVMYFDFDTSALPETFHVTKALYQFQYRNDSTDDGRANRAEVFKIQSIPGENNPIHWFEEYQKYTTAGTAVPYDEENRLHAEEMPPCSKTSFTPQTLTLKPELLTSKDDFHFAMRLAHGDYPDQWTYGYVNAASGSEPVIILSYY